MCKITPEEIDMKLPKTRFFQSGNTKASLEAHNKGYSLTFSRNGKVFCTKTFYLSDGYNRSVGRLEALRELKRGHFKEIK